ncbi:hypothetical protein ACIRF8_08240 [Streptomyces sp. NPDC102406]|uniref:hypothetical protein n=1 Tax=Streptomyces sp. NPDC102406 TaxID=3366171 RepID=UPI0037F1B1E2
MPAAGDEWWWRLLAAATPRLDHTEGAGGASGTDAAGGTGAAAPADAAPGDTAPPPGERPSFGAVVIHVVADDARTRRAGLMYAQISGENRRQTRLLLFWAMGGALVLLGGLAGLVVVVQALGVTSPWAMGSVIAAATSPITAIAYGFTRLLLRCAEGIRSPLSVDAPPPGPDPAPDPGAPSRP